MSTSVDPEVQKLLEELRTHPRDTTQVPDSTLQKIFQYLIGVPPCSDGRTHWFCKKANTTTVDAAVFLLRLMAYDSPQVLDWKRKLHNCLSSCTFCAQRLEEEKVASRKTFFAVFPDDTLHAFFAVFNKWELEEVHKDLDRISRSTPASGQPLPALVNGTLYRILCNWEIFCDGKTLSFIQTQLPVNVVVDLSEDPLPPGLLILLTIGKPDLRSWAENLVSRCNLIDPAIFKGAYEEAMDVVRLSLETSPHKPTEAQLNSIPARTRHIAQNLEIAPPFELWSGLRMALRVIPPQWLKSPSGTPLQMKRIIMNHLRDIEPYFAEVLKCFILMLKRLSQDVWKGEAPESPQSIFDAITDNPHYINSLQSSSSEKILSNLSWMPEFLATLSDHGSHSNIIGRAVQFLCDETRHEGSADTQAACVFFATRIIRREMKKNSDDALQERSQIITLMENHFPTIVSKAYDERYNSPSWKPAQDTARGLVEDVLTSDIKTIPGTISKMSHILGQEKLRKEREALPTFGFRKNIWEKLYSTVRSPDAVASIVRMVADSAYIDRLKLEVFTKQWDYPQGDEVLIRVNQTIESLQSGFFGAISSFVEYSNSTNALNVLGKTNVAKAVTLLLLSPIQDYHAAAKVLVGLAFDVDGRLECFRAMLSNFSNEALDAMLEFLQNFCGYASVIPEASSVSAALVRCFADILEVLCASPDGLLLNPHFLRPKEDSGPASKMLKFWKLLTKSLRIIYYRASMWAVHIDTPDMVLWMRDALILARDFLKQWRVIENASNSVLTAPKTTKQGELSPSGKQMIDALQSFLPELIRWLRLTDEELLHQSFSLLQSLFDLMKETHVRPSETALEKLSKYLEGALSADESTREQRTRLDRGRLLQLSEVLSYFRGDGQESDDDEVVIVSHTKPKKDVVPNKSQVKPEPRSYIQGKLKTDKSTSQPKLPYASSSRSSSSKFFSDKDQAKLDSVVSMPSFKRSSLPTPASSGSSKGVIDTRRPLTKKPEPKNEAIQRQALKPQDSESSDSESEDSDTDVGTEAFKQPLKDKSPKKPKVVERRQIKTLDIPINANPMEERLARNRRAHFSALRMRPDISSLHRIMLAWDYTQSGPVPPGKPLQTYAIPDRFKNYEHYFHVFQPLLLMECWAQLQQSKEEKQDSYSFKIDSRAFVDDWLDIDISISEAVRKEWYLADTDVVLLRHPAQNKCILALVKSYRPSVRGITATVRCYTAIKNDPGLQVGSTWQISKVFSLSTLHREYAALVSLQYNDICDFILQPMLTKTTAVDRKDLKETMDNYGLNEPQASAILKSMKTEGFSLIQGPPGTGKTSTITGLVARFLAKRPRAAVPITVGKATAPSSPPPPTARILLCAPSNAAVDEIAQRIKDGYAGSCKSGKPVNIVRVGAEQALNNSVKDISLDYLVDQKLDALPKGSNDSGNEVRLVRQELEAVKKQRGAKLDEMQNMTMKNSDPARRMTLEDEVKVLNSRRQNLIMKLDQLKDQEKSDSRTLNTLRRNTRREILNQADIICTTLSGAGHDTLENLEFSMVIIDEAAQAIELSSLIPLKYGCSQCVMVGDPQQLPPTVLSQEATRFGYNQSLFVRLQRSRTDAVHLLSIQYRMHPDISILPSRVFYDGRLLDGPNMAIKTKQPWHSHDKFGVYKFFNISWGLEESNGHSIKNLAECRIAVDLYARLRQEFSSVDFDFRIGVVSMYKAQINALRTSFIDRFGRDIVGKIDFNTVDGFQGQEKDVIILSCVRAGPGLQTVGFLSDIRRMNVALTRAKSSLYILGNTPTLERSDANWKKIVEDARSRSALENIDAGHFVRPFPPSATKETAKKKAVTTIPPTPPENNAQSNTSTTTTIPPLSTPKEYKTSIDNIPKTSTSSSSVPIPVLSTPKEYRATLTNAARVATSSTTTQPPAPVNADATPIASGSSSSGATRGTKRTIDNAENPPKRKQEPPRKKPKQQTMFIPKKRT
ncbi:hypothetical protein CPC08DRAFT_750035 [Agrocybe pediades]|nr:hypothetical protein CPC08DRAFT_750035 [Agrocybe pediades]